MGTSDRDINVSAAKHARQIAYRSRPWQLLTLSGSEQPSFQRGDGCGSHAHFGSSAHVAGLTLQTKSVRFTSAATFPVTPQVQLMP